ncbi:unnamed protein product [Scytosiphon promiscuus]
MGGLLRRRHRAKSTTKTTSPRAPPGISRRLRHLPWLLRLPPLLPGADRVRGREACGKPSRPTSAALSSARKRRRFLQGGPRRRRRKASSTTKTMSPRPPPGRGPRRPTGSAVALPGVGAGDAQGASSAPAGGGDAARASFGSNRSAASGGDPPLPPGWEEKRTSTGQAIYINHVDKSTSLERPAPAVAARVVDSAAMSFSPAYNSNISAVSVDPASGELPLPPGWSVKQTAEGKTYYVNNHDKTTSWERPGEAALPHAVAVPEGRTAHSRSSGSGASSGTSNGAYGGRATGGAGQVEPLPAGWSEKTTSSGAVYYENHATRTTSWERPVAPAVLAHPAVQQTHGASSRAAPSYSSTGGGGEAPLPPGWSAKTTSSGAVYYENHATKTTSWDRPTWDGPAAPAVIAQPVAPQSRGASIGVASPYSSTGGGGEAPLPPGWSAKTTSSGAVYYDRWRRSWGRGTAAAGVECEDDVIGRRLLRKPRHQNHLLGKAGGAGYSCSTCSCSTCCAAQSPCIHWSGVAVLVRGRRSWGRGTAAAGCVPPPGKGRWRRLLLLNLLLLNLLRRTITVPPLERRRRTRPLAAILGERHRCRRGGSRRRRRRAPSTTRTTSPKPPPGTDRRPPRPRPALRLRRQRRPWRRPSLARNLRFSRAGLKSRPMTEGHTT